MTAAMTRTSEGTTLPAVGTWELDASHSTIGFSVRHLGISKVRGVFSTFSGTVEVAEEPTGSAVQVVVDVASIDTKDANRDEHLRTNDFFSAPEHPTMTFASTSIAGGGTQWLVTGDLTIRGVTHRITLDTTFEGLATDPWGGDRAAFSATAEVDREDFGMTWNAALETGGVLVGKKVKVEIEAELVRTVADAG